MIVEVERGNAIFKTKQPSRKAHGFSYTGWQRVCDVAICLEGAGRRRLGPENAAAKETT